VLVFCFIFLFVFLFFLLCLTTVCRLFIGVEVIVALYHTHTHSVGLLWTSDLLVTETCTWLHTTLTWDTAMHPAGLEPAIPVSERPQTHVLDRVAPGIGFVSFFRFCKIHKWMSVTLIPHS
jgi:hypothetical protein